jgi:hypothetical protein
LGEVNLGAESLANLCVIVELSQPELLEKKFRKNYAAKVKDKIRSG